jgi:hypothetical protein
LSTATDLDAAPLQAAQAPRLRATTISIAIAVAIGFYLWRLIGLFTQFPGTRIDARFNQVVLEHLWLWTTGRADALADPAFFYPYKSILYLSDAHFGSGWIYVIFRALGAPREIAFDLWFLVGMATSFAAAAFVLRRFGLPTVAALFGACVFAFSLPMLAQDAHAQLVYRFATPLAALAAIEWLRGPSLRRLATLTLWVAWQFLCSVYLGVFLVEFLALFAAVASAARLRPRSAAPAGLPGAALAWLAAPAAALAAYMLWRHAEVSRSFGIQRMMSEVEGMAPHWTSLLSQQGAPTDAWFSSLLPQHTQYWQWEHQLFPGFGVLLLAAVGAWSAVAQRENRAAVAACVFAILGLLALTMDIDGAGLYRWLAQAPGLNAIRSPGRVTLVMAFPLAWLAALGVARLRQSGSQAAAVLLTVGLFLSLVDIAGYRSASVDIAASRARVATMAAGLDGAALRAQRAVLVRFGDGETWDEAMQDIDLMIVAQDLGVSAYNGYSGSYPPMFKNPRNCADARAVIASLDALPFKRAGADDVAARAVIVPPGACEGRQ